MKIALIDSGIGGLTLLNALLKGSLEHQYIYFADTFSHPYGTKRRDYLLNRLRAIVTFLEEKGAEVIILACNTASSVALETLNSEFSLPVLGVIPKGEPEREKTLVMCTPLTARSAPVLRLKEKGAEIYANPCLAKMVERYHSNLNALKNYLYLELKDYSVERVVLGCTHYVFLKDMVSEITGAKCDECMDEVIDYVARLPKGEKDLSFIFTARNEEQRYRLILEGGKE